jgi:hypothetical protein
MKLRLALAVVLALATGCRDSSLKGKGCQADSDCGAPASAFRCELQTGSCYCRTNEACTPREFCNTAGFCQDRAGCEKNADCLDPSLFCDTSSGTCLSKGRCTVDLQCPLGQVCDAPRSVCVDGCHSSGDCPGTSCLCGDKACACLGQTPAEVAACPRGTCEASFCADNSFCAFGELCGARPDAGPLPQCYSDYDPSRRPYCANCTWGGGIDTCGTGPNYCITDTQHPGTSFCGADCAAGQTCPRGYNCSDIIIVYTRWKCTAANPFCPADPALPCATDTDCKRGGSCVKAAGMPNGFCAGQCRIREGAPEGYCSCQVDPDCAQETCSAGECSISRRPCVSELDCRAIHCVDFKGAGGCLIGQNCTPGNGLTCLEVQ